MINDTAMFYVQNLKNNVSCIIDNKINIGCMQQQICEGINDGIIKGGFGLLIAYIIYVYFADWFFDKWLIKNSNLKTNTILRIKYTLFQSILLCFVGFVAYVCILSTPFFNSWYGG